MVLDRVLLVEQRAQTGQRLFAQPRDLIPHIRRRQARLEDAQVDGITSPAHHRVVQSLCEFGPVFGRHQPAIGIPVRLQISRTNRTESRHLSVHYVERRWAEPHAANQDPRPGSSARAMSGAALRPCGKPSRA